MYCPRSLKCLERMEDSSSKNNLSSKKESSFSFRIYKKKLLNIEIERYREKRGIIGLSFLNDPILTNFNFNESNECIYLFYINT